VGERVERVYYLSRHIQGTFGDESFQAIGTGKPQQLRENTYKPNPKMN